MPKPWILRHSLAPALLLTLLFQEAAANRMGSPGDGMVHAGFFVTLLIYAVLFVASELLRPKPALEDARPAGLGDFKFPTATEGRVVPIIWGRVKLSAPNVVWYGDLRQEAIEEEVKTGLWSKDTVVKGFRYYMGVQFALCRGFDAITKVWVGDDVVYSSTSGAGTITISQPELFGGDDLGAGGVAGKLDIFVGSDPQTPSSYLAQFQDAGAGTDRTPGYIGTGYCVFRENVNNASTARGGYIGNSTTIKPWAFEVERYPALFSGQTSGDNAVNSDANPVNVLYELLTHPEWGLDQPAADIDVGVGASFTLAAATCKTEGNGFSMVLDRPRPVVELIREIERQIDGVLFLDHQTGIWKLKLARFDYTPSAAMLLDDDNVKEVRSFTHGAWEDTSNRVVVEFDKRSNNYNVSFAKADDIANAQVQGGGTTTTTRIVTVSSRYPGIKNAALASQIAWRDLRTVSYPLARASLTANRQAWDLRVGDVVRWSNAKLGISELVMRVSRANYGNLSKGNIELDLVQDVFHYRAASGGSPPATKWDPPSDTLEAFPSDEQLAFEAPRAIHVKDPEYSGDDTSSRVWCGARRNGNEASFYIYERHAAGTPSGSYDEAGQVYSFLRIGALKSDLAAGTAVPTSSITLEVGPDSQTAIEEVFNDGATIDDLGNSLSSLIMVGNEFMLVKSASTSGADVVLANVYRGVLDSVQGDHSATTPVYLLFVGGGLCNRAFVNTYNVDIKLLPRSRYDTLAIGDATAISVALSKRAMRPLPPAEVSIDGSRYDTAPSLEGSGSGLDGFRNDYTWLRRDFRSGNEVSNLLDDAGTLFADFPTANSTEYRVSLYGDPSGTNDLVYQSGWVDGSSAVQVTRTEILAAMTGGVLPTEIRVLIRARHDYGSETDLASRYDLDFTFSPTSSLTGQFALGAVAANVASNAYTAAATGTFTVNLGTLRATSNVQYRINGGTWTTTISAGGTTGTIPGVSSSDTIEIRHTASDGSDTFVELKNPSSTSVAYGVLLG